MIYTMGNIQEVYLVLEVGLGVHRFLIASAEVNFVDWFFDISSEVILECRAHLLLEAELESWVDCQVHAGCQLVLDLFLQLFLHAESYVLVSVIRSKCLMNLVILSVQLIVVCGWVSLALLTDGLPPNLD